MLHQPDLFLSAKSVNPEVEELHALNLDVFLKARLVDSLKNFLLRDDAFIDVKNASEHDVFVYLAILRRKLIQTPVHLVHEKLIILVEGRIILLELKPLVERSQLLIYRITQNRSEFSQTTFLFFFKG